MQTINGNDHIPDVRKISEMSLTPPYFQPIPPMFGKTESFEEMNGIENEGKLHMFKKMYELNVGFVIHNTINFLPNSEMVDQLSSQKIETTAKVAMNSIAE